MYAPTRASATFPDRGRRLLGVVLDHGRHLWLGIVLVVLTGCGCRSPAMQPATNEPLTIPDYNRSEWGRWSDDDGDCQNTRQEVLIAESLEAPTLDERGCRVLLGRWKCPYTGVEVTDPRVLDIDHVVPLYEAHFSGGSAWGSDRKSAFFNDLVHPEQLIAVDRSANRSKGSKQPHEWMPPNEAYRCEYLRAWVGGKAEWELKMDCDETQGLVKLLTRYCR